MSNSRTPPITSKVSRQITSPPTSSIREAKQKGGKGTRESFPQSSIYGTTLPIGTSLMIKKKKKVEMQLPINYRHLGENPNFSIMASKKPHST